jgi:hypothetical protein
MKLLMTFGQGDVSNDTGVDVVAVTGNNVNIPATPANYTLSNLKFTIVRYDLPSEFYMTEASRLVSGTVFKLWFPNYSVQSCPTVAAGNKQGVNRTSISCRSLDWVMGTFRLPNYTNIEAPLNSLWQSPSRLGPVGQGKYTWKYQVLAGLRRLFNNSRYFAHDGSSITNCTWKIGHSEYPSRNVQQQFDALLKQDILHTMDHLLPTVLGKSDTQNILLETYNNILTLLLCRKVISFHVR